MADAEPAGGYWESKDDTVLNEKMLTELAAKVVAPSSTAAEVQTDDQKPTTTMDGEKKDDYVMDIARRFVGDVAEMEGIEGFGLRYIDSINSYFFGLIRHPEAPRGSASSGFFKVPKEIRYRAGSEGLYDPTFFNLTNLRALLLEMNNNGTGTDHQLRHYFSHLFSILKRVVVDKSTLKYVMKKIFEKREELARCYDVAEQPRNISSSTDFPHLLALLLGGCFVFDTVFRWYPSRVYIECCHLWASELWVDLLLLDNQIPFFDP